MSMFRGGLSVAISEYFYMSAYCWRFAVVLVRLVAGC